MKMAQDKEMLKESINEIEALVSKLESDNVALNNTLKLVMSSNQQFRQHTIVGVLTGNKSPRRVLTVEYFMFFFFVGLLFRWLSLGCIPPLQTMTKPSRSKWNRRISDCRKPSTVYEPTSNSCTWKSE